jgi:hypothetical protein
MKRSNIRKFVLTFLVLLLVLTGSQFKLPTGRAAVTLLYFSAISENQQVRLVWQTATEMNNAGFFVQRSTQQGGSYIRVNPEIIPAQGDSLTGASYTYTDPNLTNGAQYWYRLEMIDLGQNSEYSGSVFVIVGATPTPTTSVTGTATPSPTATSTSTSASLPGAGTATSTATPTRTATPQQFTQPSATINFQSQPPPGQPTIYPAPGQPGLVPPDAAVAAPTNASFPGQEPGSETGIVPTPVLENNSGEATATLIPFPTVTIVFPRSTSQQSAPLPDPADLNRGWLTKDTIQGLWPIGLLIVIWLGLVAWFFLSRRHIG